MSKTKVRVTLSTFDNPNGWRTHTARSEPIYRCLRKAEKLKDFKPVTEEDYSPRGATPLIDATVQFIKQIRKQAKAGEVHVGLLLDESGSMAIVRAATISSVNEFVGSLKSVDKVDPKVDGKGFLVIATDGYENASSEFKYEDVTALLKDCEADGWVVIFLGAGIDAWSQGSALGLRGTVAGQTVSSVKSPVGTRSAFASVANDGVGYLSDSDSYSVLRASSSVRSLSEDGKESTSGGGVVLPSAVPVPESRQDPSLKTAIDQARSKLSGS